MLETQKIRGKLKLEGKINAKGKKIKSKRVLKKFWHITEGIDNIFRGGGYGFRTNICIGPCIFPPSMIWCATFTFYTFLLFLLHNVYPCYRKSTDARCPWLTRTVGKEPRNTQVSSSHLTSSCRPEVNRYRYRPYALRFFICFLVRLFSCLPENLSGRSLSLGVTGWSLSPGVTGLQRPAASRASRTL
jgi:hypothetical protein